MELLERTHATDLAHAVRGAAETAANQAAHAAHKAGDRASGLIDPIVEPLRGGHRRRGGWSRAMRSAQRHPWALAATLAVLVGIVYMATREAAKSGLDIDDVAADADNRFRSAA